MPLIIIACSGVPITRAFLDKLCKYGLLSSVIIGEPPIPTFFYELQNSETLDEFQSSGVSDEPQHLPVSNAFVKRRGRYPSINNSKKYQINICKRKYITLKRIHIP
jgi:hypothetical protein